MSKGHIVNRIERLRNEMQKTGTVAFVAVTDEASTGRHCTISGVSGGHRVLS
jgi:hypothetical protein